MKKILLTLEYPPMKGGVAVYLENLVRQFAPDEISVIAPADVLAANFDSRQPYRIARAKLQYRYFWPHWLKSYFIAKREAKKNQADHLIISHLLPMGYLALMLGLPYTVIIHGMDVLSASQTAWKRMCAKRILSGASLIVANSHFTKEQAVNLGISADKIEVAYPCPQDLMSLTFNPDRLAELTRKYGVEGKKVLLSVNRLVSRKGNDTIIRLMPEILRKVPDAVYLIVGNGPYHADLEKLIADNNLQEKIFIINDVPKEDLIYYYRLAKLFVMPARHQNGSDVEGFGIVFLEAAMFNVPSVATFTGGIPEAIIDNVTGSLVEEGDIKNLTQVIINILQNDEAQKRLGSAAKERALNEFQWPKQFAKVVEKLK